MSDTQGELQIKDLLLKLHVLTYGIIEERKKSQTYLNRIKDIQDSLQKKETENVELTKSKFELQSKLSLELSKKSKTQKSDGYFKAIMSKIRDKPVDQTYVTELEEKTNQQEFTIKDLNQRLMEAQENFDQQKIKFQTLLTMQTKEMTDLKKELEEEKKREKIVEKIKPVLDTESKEKLRIMTEKYNREKSEFENKIDQLKKELELEKKNKDEINKLKEQIEEIKAECEMKKIENKAMKDQVSKLDKELAKAKVDIKDSKLIDRFFQVEKVNDNLMKNKKVMTIIFRYIKGSKNVKGRCEAIFKRPKHGDSYKEEVVNLLDFTCFKINDKKKDIFDVSFTVS